MKSELTLTKQIFVFLAVTTLVCNFSCTPEPDPNPQSEPTPLIPSTGGDEVDPVIPTAPTLIGEWFEDLSDELGYQQYTVKYQTDGTFKVWEAFVTKRENMVFNYDGNYEVEADGTKLTMFYNHPYDNSPVTDIETIRSLTKYSHTIYNEEYKVSDVLYRIVDNYSLQVGDTRKADVKDTDFAPTSYKSSNGHVAVVDNSGKITAVKRGFAFITVSSSTDKAVIKVVVTDPDNIIDDYTQYLGKSLSELNKSMGDIYFEGYDDGASRVRQYNMLDDNEEKVVFWFSSNNVVVDIVLWLRNAADYNAIKNSFDKKYKFLGSASDNYLYEIEVEGRPIEVFLSQSDNGTKSIRYVFKNVTSSDVPFIQYDNLINMSLQDAVSFLGYTLNADNLTAGFFTIPVDDEFFDEVSVSFDSNTYEIDLVEMRLKSDVQISDIEGWYKEKYYPTELEDTPYCNGTPWYFADVFISFKENMGRVYVRYIKI